ncbi:MAG TPA: hypothetical protein VFA00_03845 [Actinomycetota bacterium]|nr:hypothetical protein [Actinomycetota bacterium]
MVNKRDRVEVESEKVGDPPRTGVVTGVEGRLITIAWDTGGESSLVPSAGSLRVVAGRGSSAQSRNR